LQVFSGRPAKFLKGPSGVHSQAKGGDLAQATPAFKEAVRLTPTDPQAHLALGLALAKQNLFAEAMERFQAVLRLDPSNAPAKEYLRIATMKNTAGQ